MTKIQREPLIDCDVDWYAAIKAFPVMDSLDNYPPEFQGLPLGGSAIVRILADYASIAHKCSWAPEGQKLAVVVWPPEVYFCPSLEGLHGAFVQPYDAQTHGEYAYRLQKELNIWCFSNIEAMRDGWEFNAAMIQRAIEQKQTL